MKAKTRDSTLPRRRSAPALALQKPQHRQRVIPDKRRVATERLQKDLARPTGRYRAEGDYRIAQNRPTLNADIIDVECTTRETGETHGLCRDVRCDDCPINFGDNDRQLETMPVCPWSSDHGLCRDVRCTNCEHYNSGLRN